MVWAYNYDTKDITRIATSPYGSEYTSNDYYELGNFAYLTAVVQVWIRLTPACCPIANIASTFLHSKATPAVCQPVGSPGAPALLWPAACALLCLVELPIAGPVSFNVLTLLPGMPCSTRMASRMRPRCWTPSRLAAPASSATSVRRQIRAYVTVLRLQLTAASSLQSANQPAAATLHACPSQTPVSRSADGSQLRRCLNLLALSILSSMPSFIAAHLCSAGPMPLRDIRGRGLAFEEIPYAQTNSEKHNIRVSPSVTTS